MNVKILFDYMDACCFFGLNPNIKGLSEHKALFDRYEAITECYRLNKDQLAKFKAKHAEGLLEG